MNLKYETNELEASGKLFPLRYSMTLMFLQSKVTNLFEIWRTQ